MLSWARIAIGAVASIVLSSLTLAVGASPSAAQAAPAAPDAPVEQDGNDIVGGVQEQVNILQSGSRGRGPRPTCTWTQTLPDGQVVQRTDGMPRWREPRLGHDQWATNWEEWEGEQVGGGTIFRYECWHPDMGCGTESLVGGACMGEQIHDTFCGDSLCLFDAVNPPNLARLAVDGFVQNLPDPAPGFNPAGPDQASAAAAGCSRSYAVSSLGQGDDDTYQGFVAMTFDVQWQATGGGAIDGSLVAERSSSFSLAVNEAQAINTSPG